MAHDAGHERCSDGPTCLVAILAPFLVVCAIVGYVTLDRGGITQHDEETGVVQVLTWHGWEPAGQPARQLSAPPAPASGGADPTPRPAPTVILAEPTVAAALAPAAGDGTTSRYAGYSVVESAPAAPAVAAGLSPWTVLGWLLVGLVPLVLVTGTGLVVHRYLITTRRRPGPGCAEPVLPAETLPAHAVGAAVAGPAPPAESSPPTVSAGTYIADFLDLGQPPEVLAIGGYDDAPVVG